MAVPYLRALHSRSAAPVWCETPENSAAAAKQETLAPQALGALVANLFGTTVLVFAAMLALSCAGEGEGRPDEDLGDLVLSPAKEVPTVDLEKVGQDHEALLDAIALSHGWVAARLGAHTVIGKSKVVVKEGDTLVEELEDTLLLDIDGEDRFVATLDNSKDYGRHVIFDGSELYLRPRYGKYHARAPQSEDEVVQIRNQIFAGASDYLELFRSQIEVSDKGRQTLDGRAVRQVALKLAPKAHRRKIPEELSQRQWRNSIKVGNLEGLVSFDAESGVALAITFSGSVAFTRDKKRFLMFLEASRTIEKIGHERAIAAPDEELVLRIPARRRDLAERDELLRGIAPPARKAPTPKAAGKK